MRHSNESSVDEVLKLKDEIKKKTMQKKKGLSSYKTFKPSFITSITTLSVSKLPWKLNGCPPP